MLVRCCSSAACAFSATTLFEQKELRLATKTISLIVGCFLALAAAFAQAVVPAASRTSAPMAAPEKIAAISHRGEHLHHPENTMPAFQSAIDAGADFIEVDVQTTSDGKLVLMHDSTVDRTTSGTGPIKNMTFDQIRALDPGAKFSPEFAGTKVPTFDEALDLAHGKIGVYVDTKNADPQQLVDTIVAHDMQDHVVIYGNPFFLYDVHKIRPGLKVMPESETDDICKLLIKNLHLQVLAYGAGDFKDDIIGCAKTANVEVYVDRMGTTDNPAGWQQAIDMGADGIQTDKPAELVEFLRAHKIWAPGW
jgi:glycerophosphoryl diester phosphodiesterase